MIPGGSATRSKAPYRYFGDYAGPRRALSGSDAHVVCDDGRSYLDLCCALGAISLGYGAEPNRRAAQEMINGSVYSLPSVLEDEADSAVLGSVASWASWWKPTKTGSEATHAALLVAQRATGRRPYLRSRASYHGWHTVWQPDARDVQWFDDGQPMSGMADGCCAIFVEPPRWTPCTPEWLGDCRDEATRAGAVLVFDEMIYCGRWALGGASEYYGVTPDLACYGKALGNGAPIAFVAGREALAEHGELVSGTYSGDTAALAALVATVQAYTQQPVVETLWRRGRQLRRGLREAVNEHGLGLGATVEGEPVHQRLRFDDPARGFEFSARMASRGVLWHPEVVNVSAAMTKATIERVIEAAAESLKEMTR